MRYRSLRALRPNGERANLRVHLHSNGTMAIELPDKSWIIVELPKPRVTTAW